MRAVFPRSIRARLWTVITLLSGAVLGVSLMTWIGLQRVDARMQALHQQSLSRVAQAIDLSKRSSDLAASAPYLLNQSSSFLIEQEGQKLIAVLTRVRQEWPSAATEDQNDSSSIAPITQQMEQGIRDLVDASQRLDVNQSDVRQKIAQLGELSEQLLKQIENPNLDDGQRLVWWTLKSMNAHALNAAYADNLIGVGEEQRRYQREKRQVSFPRLTRPQRNFIQTLEDVVNGTAGLFELRRSELSVSLAARNALFRLRRDANLVNQLAVDYAGRAEAILLQQRVESSSSIQVMKITLTMVSLVSLLLALAAALFVSRYVTYNMAQVSSAMVRLADGDRTSVLPRRFRNDDEIGDLFRSFRTFRANALRLDRSHKQLNQRNALFEKVFTNISYGVAITDSAGRLTASNPAFARVLSLQSDALLGKSLVEWFFNGKFADSASESGLQATLRGQLELTADDGQVLELRASILPDDRRVWLIADVTENQTLAARLAQIDRIEALGKVAGDTAHDFANILSTIRTHTHLLKGKSKEPTNASLVAIQNAVEFGASLTERLLTFAKKQNLAPENIELNSLVNGMIDLVEIGLKRGVALDVRYSSEPLNILADPGQLESTLLNLILNANYAIEEYGTIKVTLSQHRNDEATIIIEDDGCGMSPHVQTRAIEPFFSTRAGEGGTGLGLSIVYGFIIQTGGNLDIESEIGLGTTVTVALPLSQFCGSTSRSQVTQVALAVDDDPEVLHALDAALKILKYDSALCGTASDALNLITEQNYKLVLSDFDLGSTTTGLDVLRTAAEHQPHAKRILISGKSSLGKLDDEAIIFVQKPITVEKLEFALRS